jgi:phytoene desaturase
MPKAIVIGAGIAGLASAVRLAKKGYAVEVFEANSYPGGKLSEFTNNGFRFDAGPSLFTVPELVDELFTLVGKNPKEYFNYERLEDVCHYFYEDGTTLTAWADVNKFAQEAQEKTGVDKRKVLKHLNKSRYIYNSTAHLFLEKSLHKLSRNFSFKTVWSILQLPFLNIFTTMDAANASAMNNEKMRQLFNRYATYNGSNPYKAPGILNIIPHLEFNKGAYFPKGGMHSITLSVYQLAKDLGVTFHFNNKVEKILVADKKAVGVSVSTKEILADVVVCNMDVVPAYRYLMPEQKQPEKILKQERSSSALIFYWGIKHEFSQLGLHNIFFSDNYKEEFAHIFDKKTIYHDPTVYINITSKLEKTDAPKGYENWFVMINVPYNDKQNWDELIPIARKNILEKLSRLLNTTIEELVVCEEILEPRTIESKTQSYKGALYGTSSNTRMAGFFVTPIFQKTLKIYTSAVEACIRVVAYHWRYLPQKL